MPSLIPNQFGRRERRLTAVAVLSGLVIACVACLTGFGTYGGWILLAIIGMFVFLAVGRQQRAYFAGVFGVTLFVAMACALAVSILFVHHEALDKDYAFVTGMLFLWLVVAPIAVGVFVSWIRRHEETAAYH